MAAGTRARRVPGKLLAQTRGPGPPWAHSLPLRQSPRRKAVITADNRGWGFPGLGRAGKGNLHPLIPSSSEMRTSLVFVCVCLPCWTRGTEQQPGRPQRTETWTWPGSLASHFWASKRQPRFKKVTGMERGPLCLHKPHPSKTSRAAWPHPSPRQPRLPPNAKPGPG